MCRDFQLKIDPNVEKQLQQLDLRASSLKVGTIRKPGEISGSKKQNESKKTLVWVVAENSFVDNFLNVFISELWKILINYKKCNLFYIRSMSNINLLFFKVYQMLKFTLNVWMFLYL